MTKTTQYKNTPIGPIPADWKVKKLGDITSIYDGTHSTPKYVSEGIPFYSVEHVSKNDFSKTKFITEEVFEKENQRVKLERNDILMTRIGDVGKARLIDWDVKASFYVSLALIKHHLDFNSKYMELAINAEIFQKELNKRMIHVAFPIKINLGEISQCLIPLPPLPEQQKIAEVLSTWDKAIQETDAIIKKLVDRNKALAFSLLRGKLNSKKSKEISLSKFLTFTPREIDKPIENYLALGIRSHGKGLFHKPDSDPKAIAMDKLYEVKENDFIVNITFAWEHAVAIVSKEDVGGLVSHRFPTYEIDTNQVKVEYFRHLILQSFFRKMLENISPGGAGRNRVLSKKDLLKLKVSIPTLEEQNAIAEILNTANQEVKQYQQKLEALKLQKKGLMQQLLTGKVRTV